MKLLLVEDDKEISAMLKDYLAAEAFEVDNAYDGQEAWEKFREQEYALVLLDLMIPRLSGLDVMQRIRQNSTVPIIILTAKDSDSDKTAGLGLGADDYITKPFSLSEVAARVKANIRRTTQYAQAGKTPEPRRLQAGELSMDLETYEVKKSGEPVELTAKEFEILRLLIQNPKKVYTKEQLYTLVWQDAYLGDENAVNVHISRLRTKIEDNPRKPRYIQTVWGIGYKLGDVKV